MALINFSGIASGLDTEGLIKATSDATRKTRVTPLSTRVTELTDSNDALTTLKSKFETLKGILEDMNTLSGGAVAKQVTSSSEALLTASASNGAINGTYTVSLGTSAKANNGVQSLYDIGEDDWTSLSAPFKAGATITGGAASEITITVGGEAETITISDSTTIADVVSTFNSNNSKGVMSAVNVGTTASPKYRLMVSALSSGATDGAVSISLGSDFTAAVTTTTAQAASNASFTVNGLGSTITRSSNTVTDVLPGVNFTIQSNPTTSTDVTLEVSNDVTATISKVQKFVDAWNDIVEYIKDNNLVTRDETDSQNPTNVFGVLAKTSIDDDALSAMRSTLSSAKYTSGSRVRILADLGIQTQQDGTLKFKIDGASSEVTFKEALAEEPNSVNELLKSFADTMSKTGGTIGLYTGFGRGFSLTINNNEEQITELNRRISDIEGRIAKTEQSMRSRFASLESNIGRLQQQQSALNSALGGLR